MKNSSDKQSSENSPPQTDVCPELASLDFFKSQRLLALRNRGLLNPEEIDEYIALGGYAALPRALFDMTPEAIVERTSARSLTEVSSQMCSGLTSFPGVMNPDVWNVVPRLGPIRTANHSSIKLRSKRHWRPTLPAGSVPDEAIFMMVLGCNFRSTATS